jgi:tRNA-dihydrouridine synthase B
VRPCTATAAAPASSTIFASSGALICWSFQPARILTVTGIRTAAQSYSGESDWSLISRVAEGLSIPVFGSGDCIESAQVVSRLNDSAVAGVLVGRGALRNPWIFRQAADAASGGTPQAVTLEARGQFLLDYLDLLLHERAGERPGFRHSAPGHDAGAVPDVARGRERWVINKLRALNSWYTKGLDNGSRLRIGINNCESIADLRQLIHDFFFEPAILAGQRT